MLDDWRAERCGHNLTACTAKQCDARDAVAQLARAEKVIAAAHWAMPLAKLALEAHRLERLRCGHAVGTKMIGLYDAEVDEMRRHETAVAEYDRPSAPLDGRENNNEAK